jgi:hypothetical protein
LGVTDRAGGDSWLRATRSGSGQFGILIFSVLLSALLFVALNGGLAEDWAGNVGGVHRARQRCRRTDTQVRHHLRLGAGKQAVIHTGDGTSYTTSYAPLLGWGLVCVEQHRREGDLRGRLIEGHLFLQRRWQQEVLIRPELGRRSPRWP